MIYAYPKLSNGDFWFLRVGGNGLGNLLFTWARCIVTADHKGYRMIEPTWRSLKPKNFIKGFADYRVYGSLFKPLPGNVAGLSRLLKLASLPRLPENSSPDPNDSRDRIVVFRGMEGFFHPFLDDHELVRRKLLSMTRPVHAKAFDWNPGAAVCVHVRLGDFRRFADERLILEGTNVALPMRWYVGVIRKLREAAGWTVPAYIFSDGRDEELRQLLDLGECRRVTFDSSIADILALSKARVLVTSHSTFSMWASFLGRMPVIWYRGKIEQRLYSEAPELEVELGYDDPVPDVFASALRR